MDEPFSALDPLIRREMQDELLDLQKRLQKTIVFITHDLNEALKLGDRIAIMRDGMIIQLASPEEIVENPADDYVEDFIRDISKTQVLGAGSIMQQPKASFQGSESSAAALRTMQAGGEVYAFVLGDARTLVGVVSLSQVAEAANGGAELIQDVDMPESPLYSKVAPDTSIDELIPLAAQTECPIAVVNDDGRLMGVIPRTALLASLAENQSSQGREEAYTRV